MAPFAEAEFKAAIIKGAMSNEAVAYTRREAAGKALNAIAFEVAETAQTSNERITRTIGSYQGLLLRAQATPLMALAVEHNSAVEAITGSLIKLGNDQGVFASIDWQIRDIPEGIVRIDQEGVRND